MFKIQQNPEFSHKVKVRVPVDGGFADQELTVRYAVRNWDDVVALDHDPAEQVRFVMIGWEGVVDEAGNEVPYSDEAREMLISQVYARVAIVRAYIDALVPARRGN